ncbi:TRAF family member-associated NF-kappa-B activator isoform X2 [Scleropages formosus]|uniref:TRAF family member-associated NFKB activator n=2 Tax=Scleropages formosus TaxID=113540 RepID=A0A8C9SH93_SCLFO|nr:TRAF family member-associated NF-kappa-B activator isoform X2 [Scleropages formosus]XP_018597010.1 TRAF family member-associated NF-kappa-B activator isoform X2 [Scleropages formosus]
MDRNIGDQLNKAFEAYRQASIEKESAKKKLQQKTEHFERYTQKLEKQIEDQKHEISELRAQLQSLTAKHGSGEMQSYESAPRKQEVETLSSCDDHPDNTSSSSQRRKMFVGNTEAIEMPPLSFSTTSRAENEKVFDTFKELQGTFQRIQALTRKQNDHLRKIWRRSDTAIEQQFSMPIQCTDVTAEQAEGPFSSTIKPQAEEQLPSGPLASRGSSPVDGDFIDSLKRLSVKFPPSADSEYEFLNSAPERPPDQKEMTLGDVVPQRSQDKSLESLLPYSGLAAITASCSAAIVHEGVRGPQQALWSPELCTAQPLVQCTTPRQSESPGKCAFCNAAVPNDHIYSHLNSHFQKQASNGH